VKGTAFIPAPNGHLKGLVRVNRDLVASVQEHRPKTAATRDCDATLVETQKEDALFSYKGYKAYQPFNVWWAEAAARPPLGVPPTGTSPRATRGAGCSRKPSTCSRKG